MQETPGVLRRISAGALGGLMKLLVGFLGWRLGRATPEGATLQTAFLLESESGRLRIPARDRRVDCTLGRFDVDLVIEASSVSRRHARFLGTSERLQVMDLGSTNGTFVNGRPCIPAVAVAVTPGDRLRFGDQEFTLEAAAGVGA